jgi:hypothetical protein
MCADTAERTRLLGIIPMPNDRVSARGGFLMNTNTIRTGKNHIGLVIASLVTGSILTVAPGAGIALSTPETADRASTHGDHRHLDHTDGTDDSPILRCSGKVVYVVRPCVG